MTPWHVGNIFLSPYYFTYKHHHHYPQASFNWTQCSSATEQPGKRNGYTSCCLHNSTAITSGSDTSIQTPQSTGLNLCHTCVKYVHEKESVNETEREERCKRELERVCGGHRQVNWEKRDKEERRAEKHWWTILNTNDSKLGELLVERTLTENFGTSRSMVGMEGANVQPTSQARNKTLL